MRMFALAFALICSLFAVNRAAEAAVSINVDLSAQKMYVHSGSGENYTWNISSARAGFVTPHGSYKPYSLQRMHYSKKYHNSPMPYSIFFRGGYAIHGTYSVAELGRPASHGCVRLAPANAAKLFSMVQQDGANIAIAGTPPGGRTMVAKAHQKHKTHLAKAHSRHRTQLASHRTHHANPLAYAPVKHTAPLKTWMGHPSVY